MDRLRGSGSGAGNDENGTCEASQEPSHLISDQGTRRVKRDIRRSDLLRVEMRLHVTYGSSFSVGSMRVPRSGLDRIRSSFLSSARRSPLEMPKVGEIEGESNAD